MRKRSSGAVPAGIVQPDLATPPLASTVPALPAHNGAPAAGWSASLELEFAARDGATVLARREHSGPLLVQRPFYPEGKGVCHVLVVHPPGGIVGGDQVALHAVLQPGAAALLTTPAATKLYRSAGPEARVTQQFQVPQGAALEWLPQETIAFAGTRTRLLTRVNAAAGGRFIGWEILCLGRPAAGEVFATGSVDQGWEILLDGRPVLLERARYAGGQELLGAPWGLRGRPVSATLVAVGAAGMVQAVRDAAGAAAEPGGSDELFAVTALDAVLVCRYLGGHTQRARELFIRAWRVIRPALLGRPAVNPRIWSS